MTKEIPLTQGQKAIVDDEDFEWLSKHKWFARWDKKTKSFRAMRTEYLGDHKFKSFYMAREVARTPVNLLADHINHDTLDNRKSNLRNITQSQNAMNRINKTNKLKAVGITVHGNGFRARIGINRTRKSLGTFPTLEEAIAAYKSAAEKYFGEYRLQA